jgi:hypothetical protein
MRKRITVNRANQTQTANVVDKITMASLDSEMLYQGAQFRVLIFVRLLPQPPEEQEVGSEPEHAL